MMSAKKQAGDRRGYIIGWRELVGLPDLGIPLMKAKIDTGARTSALHAEEQELFEREGVQWVRFLAPSAQHAGHMAVEAPLRDLRSIKNTSGVSEQRLVVRTTLLLGHFHWQIDVSLANRKKMDFDLILGRTAIRNRNVLVNPGKSFVANLPSKAISQRDPAS